MKLYGPLARRVMALLGRPGSGRIGMTDLRKALGLPRGATRQLQRVVAELETDRAVQRKAETHESARKKKFVRHVFLRPVAPGSLAVPSGLNAPVPQTGLVGVRHPGRRARAAYFRERSAYLTEQARRRAEQGKPDSVTGEGA